MIASLNGATLEGWTGYARAMQDAAAAAIELTIYYLPGNPRIRGRYDAPAPHRPEHAGPALHIVPSSA